MRRAGLCVLTVTLGLTSGCSAVANAVLPVSRERRLGVQMAAELEQGLKLVRDPVVVDYVRGLGELIVDGAAGDIPEGIEFTFYVVDDDTTVNAFAIPGGNIYIFTGLLKLAEDEAELMGVLGHEVAHVTRRHIAQQLTAQYGLQFLTNAIGLFGGITGMLGQLAGSVASQGYLLKYSRDHEREADLYGVIYETRAGRDPHGMARFFAKMDALDAGGNTPTFLLTHPDPEERVENVEEHISELVQVPTETGRERYQQLLQRLGATAK
jgi:beta-barrel assembly-enhancing protease